MYIVDEEEYLAHFGILGMRWGRRKERETGQTKMSRKQRKKLEKAQKEWDRKANSFDADVWNRAADKFDDELLPSLRNKYTKKYGDEDGWDDSIVDEFNNEADDSWGQLYTSSFLEIYGDRPA